MTPVGGTAARITPQQYEAINQVLTGDTTTGSPFNHKRFTVTPQVFDGDIIQTWKIDHNGKLEKSDAEVPYTKLEHYLSHYAAGGTAINRVKIIDTIPNEDFVGTSVNAGELGRRIKTGNKKVALTGDLRHYGNLDNMGNCFKGCTNLVSVERLPSVEIMSGCFSGCTSLVEVLEIPGSIHGMAYCFDGCTSLNRVTLNCSYYDAIGAFLNVFSGCNSLVDGGIKVPQGQLQAYKDHAGNMGTTADKFSGF